MSKLARSLATLAVAVAVPWTAAALDAGPGREPPQAAGKAADVKTVEVQKADEKGAIEVQKVETTTTTVQVEVVGKVEAKEAVKVEYKEAVKVEKKADKVVAARRAVAPPAQNLDPWIQQMTPQLRPMVAAQVHLLATACSPTKEQLQAFKAEGDRVLKDVARECAEAQTGQRPGKGPGDPNQLVAKALTAALKDKLTAEQWARFEVETKARAAARKHLVVQNLVASLDDELMLSPDQRAGIVAAMEKNYDDTWCSTLQVLMYGTQFFPSVPNELINPHLTGHQKTAWAKRTRNGTMAWWNFGHNGNNLLLDEEPPEPPPAAPPAPAEAKKAR